MNLLSVQVGMQQNTLQSLMNVCQRNIIIIASQLGMTSTEIDM